MSASGRSEERADRRPEVSTEALVGRSTEEAVEGAQAPPDGKVVVEDPADGLGEELADGAAEEPAGGRTDAPADGAAEEPPEAPAGEPAEESLEEGGIAVLVVMRQR
jgi:hypothetical protein